VLIDGWFSSLASRDAKDSVALLGPHPVAHVGEAVYHLQSHNG